jgi:ATP-dependent helicase/nuclease subunit B
MIAVGAAADRQQLLRSVERDCGRRWQQRRKHAQQNRCCNPSHAVSVHAVSLRRSSSSLRYKTSMEVTPVIAAAFEAGDTMIASSARAARALQRLHGEAQRSRGLEAWQSPDILDWDSWLNRLWQRRLRSGGETRLLLTTLQEQQIWTRLIKPSIEGRRLISVPGVAELAQHAYALLCAYGALNFLHGERLGNPDVDSFRGWARAFERTCGEEELLSRGKLPLVLRPAVLADQFEATPRLVLTGFDRITPAQQELLEAFRERGHEVVMAEAANAAPAETMLLVEAVDKQDEIATCALWIQRELAAAVAQNRTVRIAVVVPGVSAVRPEIERAFRQILAPESVALGERELPLPYEFSLGVPLANVPMARSALLLLRWMNEALLQDQISWLLLSGFVCEQQDELLPIANFDLTLRRRPMRQPEQDLETFLHSAKLPDNLRRRMQGARRLLPQDGLLNFAQWVHVADQILDTVHWPGAHVLQSDDFQVQARWSQLLDSVAALAFDGRVVGYAEFLQVLERQAEQTIFAPESRDAPVQILEPLEAAGLSFDALWFLGADDASWPAAARPHPFLTRALQRTHNMPHADSTADWKLALQVTTRLEGSAEQSIFSFPSQNAEGICRPSTLVSSGTRRIEAKELRRSIGVDEYRAAEEKFPALSILDEQAAVLPWPTEQDAGGAEILRRQAACPFQSFATRRLGARPMDATDWGLEARERGSVVHKILEGLWAELKTRDALLQADTEGRLHAIVEQHVESALQKYRERTSRHSWSKAYLDAEQERIVSLIEEWLTYEAKRADFIVEAGEEKLAATVGNLNLQVRVDRIDAVAGGRVIIDYKTGQLNAVSWDGPRPDEPQLPLYAGFGKIDNLKGVLLGRVREDKMKFLGRVEDAGLIMPGDTKLSRPPYSANMLESWQNVLLDLGQQFLRGEAQVDPKQYPKTCEFCDLPGLCRIAENDPVNSDDDTDEADD